MSRRRVITERDVRRAAQEQPATLDVAEAAVTPSAVDLARALGVTLRGQRGAPTARDAAGPPPGGAAVPAPAAADAPPALRIAAGADHGGVVLKDAIVAHLRESGHLVVDHGTFNTDAVDYPDLALRVARAVASGSADRGIMVDGAGIGSGMVANKVRGVRAAPCHDVTTAENARAHNNANVLTLGGGLIGTRLAFEIVDAFLRTPFAGGRHARRVDKIDALDR